MRQMHHAKSCSCYAFAWVAIRQANAGTYARLPHDQRICTRCQHGRGNKNHLVSECTELQHI